MKTAYPTQNQFARVANKLELGGAACLFAWKTITDIKGPAPSRPKQTAPAQADVADSNND